MAKKVLIESAHIGMFKNLINRDFNFGKGKVVIIEGKNGIGKSNIINAMYWCLTGVDLNNSSQDADFIPKKHRNELGVVVDVEVTLNVAKIRRVCEMTLKGLSQSIYINDVKSETLKQGEIDIDAKLGLLTYTLSNYTNKNFVMRRFAMNPTYLYHVSPKDIRDVIVKRLVKEHDDVALIKSILDQPLVAPTISKYISLETSALIQNFYQILCSANAIAVERSKYLSGLKEDLETAKSVVDQFPLSDARDTMSENIKKVLMIKQKEFNEVDSDVRVLSSAILSYESKLDELAKKSDRVIDFSLVATNSRGNIKSALDISSSDVELDQRSTSESIYDAINLMNEYFLAVGLPASLPIFIDRAESMNWSKIYYLINGCNQVFATMVKENYTDDVEVNVL